MIIIYSRKNDTMVARFSATWIDKLKEYYRTHLNIDDDIIDCVVHKYITKVEGDELDMVTHTIFQMTQDGILKEC